MVARCNFDDAQSEAIHNYLIFALFIVTISNIILAAFSFDEHICEGIKKANPYIESQAQQINQLDYSVSDPGTRILDTRYAFTD